jgi:REP-associated tyrosine transposase
MGSKRPPRLTSFTYRGHHRYFLTMCVAERRAAFVDPARVESVVRHFLQFATIHGFAVPAYCVMPDHLHALVVGRTADADLRRFVCRFKQRTGFEWKRRTGQTLWQEGYYDRVLRDEEPSLDVIGYIADNPVAAGLAQSIAGYPLFGSTEHSIDELAAILGEWKRERAIDLGMSRAPF